MSSMSAMVPVALGLGANLGDPTASFAHALRALRDGGLRQTRMATAIRTASVNCVPGTPDFSNSAITGLWAGSPHELLALCQGIERQCGRPEVHSQHESRLLDIDILLFGAQCVQDPDLVIPHPRLRTRFFALAPLAELAGDWPVPPDMVRVADALAAITHP